MYVRVMVYLHSEETNANSVVQPPHSRPGPTPFAHLEMTVTCWRTSNEGGGCPHIIPKVNIGGTRGNGAGTSSIHGRCIHACFYVCIGLQKVKSLLPKSLFALSRTPPVAQSPGTAGPHTQGKPYLSHDSRIANQPGGMVPGGRITSLLTATPYTCPRKGQRGRRR